MGPSSVDQEAQSPGIRLRETSGTALLSRSWLAAVSAGMTSVVMGINIYGQRRRRLAERAITGLDSGHQ